jgi:N-acetylmuramoyl-L-alanine amidase
MNVINKYNLTPYDDTTEEETTMLIAIDAGHGLKTAGKRCDISIDPKTTREWFLNDRIADRLETLLKDYNCKTMRVDDTTGDKDVPLATRTTSANNAKADVYISIHHNAGINCGTGGGVVVYYYSSKAERKTQAQALYNAVVAKNGLAGNRTSKVIKKAFYVLKNTNMAAFLIENGFMDSKTDVPIILTQEHAEKTAHGILDFLVKTYSLKLNKQPTSTSTGNTSNNAASITKKTVYRVQCGAFTVKKNAQTLKSKLTAAGYDAFISEDATAYNRALYRVQCGAFSVKKNAEALKKKLKNAGYDAIIV